MSEMLDTITCLSHEFGGMDYVCGGGGNTSCKDDRTLWIKPSGTTLAGLRPSLFLPMDRRRMQALSGTDAPADPSGREAFIRTCMEDALCVSGSGRPSVEAPLHESFSAQHVVHTHPALLNGMACARRGEDACRRLFPDALWVPYTDPGYALCMRVRIALRDYTARHGREPSMVVLQNHGVFVAGGDPETIRTIYAHMMTTLRHAYEEAGISCDPVVPPPPPPDAMRIQARIRDCFGVEAVAFVASCGWFDIAMEPLTPDHIVYAGVFPFTDPLSREAADAYLQRHGKPPRLVMTDAGIHGLGTSPAAADLALTLACDGALVCRLAEAFGGFHPMDEASWRFIEGWEAESYRRSVSARQAECA